MEHANRRYSDEEVSAIMRRALVKGRGGDTISHDELVDIAHNSGVSQEALEAALEEQETRGEFEAAKEAWIKRQRSEFYGHLTSYCIINGFLFMVNLLTSRGYLWVVWPMLGWGIGMAFHFVSAYFPNERTVERGARKVMRKRRKHMELAEYES